MLQPEIVCVGGGRNLRAFYEPVLLLHARFIKAAGRSGFSEKMAAHFIVRMATQTVVAEITLVQNHWPEGRYRHSYSEISLHKEDKNGVNKKLFCN